MSDIERELEDELHRVLDPIAATPIPPRRSAGGRTAARTVLGGAGAALTLKLLTGVAVAAAAVTVAGAATTGSINPAVWGQQVSQHVADCKAKLTDGQHGIGDCVSDFANQHGQTVASDARQHGNVNGSTNGHGNNPNANDHAKNKNKGRSTQTKGASGQQEPTDPTLHATVTVSPQP
jgi:hypothetical protein